MLLGGGAGWRPPPNLLAAPPAAQPEPQRCARQSGEAAWEQHVHSQGPAEVCESPEGAGGWGRCRSAGARPLPAVPCGLGLSGLASLCSGEQAKAPLLLGCAPSEKERPWAVCGSPSAGLASSAVEPRSGASTALKAGLGLKDSGDPRSGEPPSTTHRTEESPAS